MAKKSLLIIFEGIVLALVLVCFFFHAEAGALFLICAQILSKMSLLVFCMYRIALIKKV